MRLKSWIAYVLPVVSAAAIPAQGASDPGSEVGTDRTLVNVVIRFGLNDTEPSTWEGTYRVTEGRLVATDGWRFTGDDYATLSEFKLSVRRFYPRFWNLRGRDQNTLPMEPNGIILTLAGLSPSSGLEVSTSRGDFTVPVGKLAYDRPKQALDGSVEYQRVPVSRQIVTSPTEDGYPSALSGPEGRLSVAYLAFTHGEGFESRPPIPSPPEDFSFLAKPTGGDRVMFTEREGEAWTTPVALTDPGGDLFGTAVALDGQGRLWAFWSANIKDNWELYGRFRAGKEWSDPVRITSSPGADVNHVAATDSEGHVWLAWQSFGPSNSDVCVARQQQDAFGEPAAVAAGPANQWAPAIAASRDAAVAVAWDSYESGNYDVLARTWRGGEWGEERLIAGSPKNEARASLAFDQESRLWIAYEVSPEGWGKDFGPYDESPKRTALYKERAVGVKVLEGQTLYEPEADPNLAMPMPGGQPRWPKSGQRVLAAGPKLAVDAGGNVWLSARVRVDRLDSAVGGTWLSFLTTLGPEAWQPAVMVPETDGFLHESSALVAAPDSGLYVISASDGRFQSAAVFGPVAGKGRQRKKDLPPPSTRIYASYPDRLFNKELCLADTGPLQPAAGECKLVEATPNPRAGPAEEARREAEQVESIRGYRATVGGKSLRIVRGEFHRHTELSSDGAGDGTLFDMWRYALDTAALDWIGNGDHDNGGGREFTWWFTQKTTSIFGIPGRFTPMYTYERSCNYPDGHRNAVFAVRGIRPLARLQGGKGKAMDDLPGDAARPNTPDTQMFYQYLRHFDGVCASHTSGTDMGTDWRDNDPKVEPIVEIYQGARQSYERPDAPRTNSAQYSIGGWRPMGFVSLALMKGYRLGFQSSSDHISTHMSYCNVWVEEPTREAILDGMKRRRVYGATDNIIADVRCGEHFMGEEFTVAEPPTLQVKLIGTAPFAEVVIVKDNQYVYSSQPNEETVEFEWTDQTAEPGQTSYYYVRGTQVGQTEERQVRSPQGERVRVELNNGEIVWVSPM
ncbi:MAG: hypothetical protein ABIP48_15130, partial [Planctomycetota bacterium]